MNRIITIGRTFSIPLNPMVEQGQAVFVKQAEIIGEMAEKSDCVIVGRCADYVLRKMHPLRLFIHADMDFKLTRCRKKGEEAMGMADKELQQKIRAVDKKRAGYYQFYTDQTWGDKAHYDLCLNTTNLNIKEAVASIAAFVKATTV